MCPPEHTHYALFGKGSSFLAFPSCGCRPKDPKAAELDFRGFLTTKVSTTWLRPVCCLRKSGQWPAVSRKRTRPQHFKNSAVRKCAKKLFWRPTLPESPPHPPPPPTPSALYMLPGLLLAHSDLMPMRFVDVDQRRSCRRDKNKPVKSRRLGRTGEAAGLGGGRGG